VLPTCTHDIQRCVKQNQHKLLEPSATHIEAQGNIDMCLSSPVFMRGTSLLHVSTLAHAACMQVLRQAQAFPTSQWGTNRHC
jgi:hypothetical protein